MGKYDNYSVEDCNKCLAELNESLDKLTKQFEAKEIKRFQYNFNKKANAKQVNEVKARLAELGIKTEALTIKDTILSGLKQYLIDNNYDLNQYTPEVITIRTVGGLNEVPAVVTEYNGTKYGIVYNVIKPWTITLVSTGLDCDAEYESLEDALKDLPNIDDKVQSIADEIPAKSDRFEYIKTLYNSIESAGNREDLKAVVSNISGIENKEIEYLLRRIDANTDDDLDQLKDMVKDSIKTNGVQLECKEITTVNDCLEEKLFGASDEVIADSKAKGLYTESKVSDLLDELDSLNFKNDDEEDEFLEFTGISRAQLEGSQGFDELDAEEFLSKISDWRNKSVITEDINSGETYVYEYYDTEEDAEATVHFFNEQGRKAEVKPEGEKYAVVLSADYFDDSKNIIESVWSSVCSNDIPFVKHAYSNKLITPNTRYTRFHDDNSFIMGALRNENFEMAELLKSFGEKILKAELPEYKRIMAEREYEDETTRTAMEESKELDTEKSKFIDNIMSKEQPEVEDFLGYKLTVDEFSNRQQLRTAIENVYDQMPEEELVKFEETKALTEMVQRFVVKQDGNVIDGMGGDSYFSNQDEAIEVAKEHTGAYVERYYYKNEQDADAREIPEDRFVVWAPEEEYEEMEDVDYEDEETISLLDIALKEVPKIGVEDWGKEDELYFVGDTVALFEALRDDEVKIPKHYYENADEYDWSNGIEDYLTDIGVDIEEGKGNNTYNWLASITHPVNFTEFSYGDELYVSFAIHREGDVRGNYTTEFLMKFADSYDFLEALDDACRENCWRELKYKDKTYYITPQFWSDCVSITCPDTGEYWDDVHCGNLSDFEEVIKQPTDEYKDTVTEDVEYMSKAEYDELADDFKGTVGEIIKSAELRGEDPEETRKLYKDLGYDENDKTVVVLDKTGGTVLKPVKLTEAPTPEDAEYKKLCDEIEFQAEENDFTLTEEDVKAIADKMIADKFFFNHDINADDNDEQAWEEINGLIVSAIEAHPNKIEESANDKVINAVRQGLSKHDVDNLSVDEDEEGNISVMYHSDKDSFPIVQNICKVADIDKATLIPELDKLDVGKTFLTEDWEELEDNN